MDREILFRGKEISRKKTYNVFDQSHEVSFEKHVIWEGSWIYGSLIVTDDGCYIVKKSTEIQIIDPDGVKIHTDTSECPDLVITRDGYATIPVNRKTVGQYTGLKDKEGARIFEGDIIRVFRDFINRDSGGYELKSVKFEGSSFTHTSGNFPMSILIDEFGTRIVGNIHDNPELLRSK